MKLFLRVFPSLLVFFALVGCKPPPPEQEFIRPIRAFTVADPDEFYQRWFPGQAKATKEVELSFRVAGPLVEFPVNVGDRLSEKDKIAQIDPKDFNVRLRNAKAKLENANAVYSRAEADYNRVVKIRQKDSGAISQAMIDRNKQVMDSSLADIKRLNADVDAARDRLGYTTLHAPFDGIVTAKYVENFEDVQAKQPILRLINHSKIEMVMQIPENMISQADALQKMGEVLIVRFDPFPGRDIKAGIKEIGKEASKTTRTYPVTLIMDQPGDITILPGMAGKAASTTDPGKENEKKSVIVPETAVFTTGEDSNTYVWIVDKSANTVHRREIKTGDLLDSGILVTQGVVPGEIIATAGVHYLKENQEIRILGALNQEVPQ